MIVKRNGFYEVRAKDGKLLGIYRTRPLAVKRLQQVEYFKRLKKGK